PVSRWSTSSKEPSSSAARASRTCSKPATSAISPAKLPAVIAPPARKPPAPSSSASTATPNPAAPAPPRLAEPYCLSEESRACCIFCCSLARRASIASIDRQSESEQRKNHKRSHDNPALRNESHLFFRKRMRRRHIVRT